MYQKVQYISAIIAVVITPTVSMLSYYAWTGDPSLRPLAASIERMRGYLVGRDDILIEVNWGAEARSTAPRKQVAKMLRSAFLSKGIDAYVVIHDRPDRRDIQVSYRVGASTFGPMQLRDTPRAVQSVVDAYRMGKGS